MGLEDIGPLLQTLSTIAVLLTLVFSRNGSAKNSGIDFGRLEKEVEMQGKTLEKLLDKVDKVIASANQTELTVSKQFSDYVIIFQSKIDEGVREGVREGISNHVRQMHKE